MSGEKGSAGSQLQPPPPPKWLDKALFQEALRRDGLDKPSVEYFVVEAATAVGDNYGSELYRMNGTLVGGTKTTLLAKVLPSSEALAKNADDAGYFPREITMLSYVVPRMEALLNTATRDQYPPMAARCPHSGTNPGVFLVLEDLTPQGFKMADRKRGLGLRHCLLALRSVARFHAASVALLEKDPAIEEKLGSPWEYMGPRLEVYCKTTIASLATACSKWPGFEEYSQSLRKFKDGAMKKYMKLNEPRSGGFNVIIHGDFRTNNFMFRYEDGKPQDVRLVDLQASHVTSPVVDLLYFLSTSPTDNVSAHYEDLLIREYHKALVDAMESLSLQPPSLQALLDDIDYHGCLALFGTVGVMPNMRTETLHNLEDTMKGDESAGAYMLEDSGVKKWLQRVLPEYRRKGWLPG